MVRDQAACFRFKQHQPGRAPDLISQSQPAGIRAKGQSFDPATPRQGRRHGLPAGQIDQVELIGPGPAGHAPAVGLTALTLARDQGQLPGILRNRIRRDKSAALAEGEGWVAG
jgi:hypothetical protein